VEGVFVLNDGGESVSPRLAISLWADRIRCDPEAARPFHHLYIRIPQAMLHPRLLNLQVLRLGRLTAGPPSIANLLRPVAVRRHDPEELTDEDIGRSKFALSEFVISGLAKLGTSCFDVAGASNFHRVCQAIELQLGDGDLTLQQISDQQHVSARYIKSSSSRRA